MALKANKDQQAALALIEGGRVWIPGQGFSTDENENITVMTSAWSRDGFDVVANRAIRMHSAPPKHELFRINQFGETKKV